MSMPAATPKPARRIYFVAGEASGDSHGAHLISALARLDPALSFAGLGGVKMQAAGMRLDHDLAAEGIMGFVEVLKHAPRLTRLMKSTAAKLRTDPPAALVLIDYPGFNIRLAKLLEGSGIPIIYYISPQVWAWKKGRIHTLARVVKKMLVIFPFEEKLYLDLGVDCVFVGHPLVENASHDSKLLHQAAWDEAEIYINTQRLPRGIRLPKPELILDALAFLIEQVHASELTHRQGVVFRIVDAEESESLESVAGAGIQEGFVHTVDTYAIRHALRSHGVPASEQARGQIGIADSDVLLLPQIVQPQNLKTIEVNARGQKLLKYEKKIDDVFFVVQEVRVGRKEMALVTMYKRPISRKSLDGSYSVRDPMPHKVVPESFVRNVRMGQRPSKEILAQQANTRNAFLIGLLPGSRAQEIARVFPEMLKIARALQAERPKLRFISPSTNEARAAQIRELAKDFPLEVIPGGMHGVLSSARFCLVASGTATLETAVFGVPFIILYRVSPITYALARLLVDIEYIGMVNILAERGVVPEYIQGNIRVPQILPQALSLIDDTPAREQMLRDLAEVRGKLGGGGASENAAREILSVINGHA